MPATPGASAPPVRDGVDLAALHGLRILLTLWLVVHHTTRWLLQESGIDPSSVALLRQGQGATTGFFILSGLALTWRYAEPLAAEPTIPAAMRFLRRRWAAVWPLGAFGALLAVPYELVEDRLAPGEFVVGLVANLALVQSWLPIGGGPHGMSLRFDGPTWTLSTLVALYAAFPAISWLVSRGIRTRRGIIALGVLPWLLVLGTAIALRGEPNAVWFLHVNPIARAADFLAGVALGTWLLRHGAPRPARARMLQLLGIALIALAMWIAMTWHVAREVRFGAMYIPAMAVLALGLTARCGPLDAALASRAARYAGARAFALAMVHTPLLGLGWHLGLVGFDRLDTTAAVLAAAAILAVFVHRWIEVPARTRLRRAPRRASAITPPVTASPFPADPLR